MWRGWNMEQADGFLVLNIPGSALQNGTQARAMMKLLLENANQVFFLQQHCSMFSTYKGLQSEFGKLSQNLNQKINIYMVNLRVLRLRYLSTVTQVFLSSLVRLCICMQLMPLRMADFS